jgi:hypothetical protein
VPIAVGRAHGIWLISRADTGIMLVVR